MRVIKYKQTITFNPQSNEKQIKRLQMINKIDDICSKMEHSQPHASFKCQRCGKCCGIVPFSKDEYNAIRKYAKDKHIGFVKAELQGKTVYFPKHAYKKFLQVAEIAEKEHRLIDNQVDGIRCPFLAYDENGLAYCTIYEYRPNICRLFGKGGHPFLTCPNNPQVNADNICR